MSPTIAIPQLAEFERRLQLWAPREAEAHTKSAEFTLDNIQGSLTYYDSAYVFFNIADYAAAKGWSQAFIDSAKTTAARGAKLLRDVVDARGGPGSLTGYSTFTHGFAEDWLRNGNTLSRDYCQQLALQGLYARDSAASGDLNPDYGASGWLRSREVAYALHAHLNAERTGAPRRARVYDLAKWALGHIDQWFVLKTANYIKPFMVGLTMSALIQYDQLIGDPKVVPALKVACDGLFATANLWVPAQNCFRYMSATDPNEGSMPVANQLDPAPDLNMLICHGFAYVYNKTGILDYRTKGDLLFQGGVLGAYFGNETLATYATMQWKQFNQSHRKSFEYIATALAIPYSAPAPTPTPTPAPTPSPTPSPTPAPPSGGTGSGTPTNPNTTPSGTTLRSFRATPVTMVMPVRQQTWEAHFIENGWRRPQDQVAAGYPLYVQPTPGTAKAILEVDMEALIVDTVDISAAASIDAVAGNVTITPSVLVSADGATWTTFAGVWNAKASNFRYCRIALDAVAADKTSVVRMPEVTVRVSVKEKTEAGTVQCNAADASGTLVTLKKRWSDITSIVVTAANQNGVEIVTAYDFVDVPNPSTFSVYLFKRSDGTRVSGLASWIVRGI